MIYTEHKILQEKKNLTLVGENKIIINKYDNKVSKIIFSFDGIIQGRIFVACKNPITKKYWVVPIARDNSLTITSNISMYPGVWELLLIGSDDEIDDSLDQSKITYVSNVFKRLVVIDNFLNGTDKDYNTESVYDPAIKEALDDLVTYRDRIFSIYTELSDIDKKVSEQIEDLLNNSVEILTPDLNKIVEDYIEAHPLDAKSAYDYAVEGGYKGSEQSFAEKMGKLLSGELIITTTDVIENGNRNPITSDAVYKAIGNVENLLAII